MLGLSAVKSETSRQLHSQIYAQGRHQVHHQGRHQGHHQGRRPVRPLGLASVLVALAASALTLSGAAQAQLYDASLFGQANLAVSKESLGGGADDVRQQGNTFEPIASFGENSAIRAYAKSVFRIDFITTENGKRGVSVCTATLVAPQVLMTNAHCLSTESFDVEEAIAWYNLIDQDGKEAQKFKIRTRAFESDTALDYALVEVLDPLPDYIKAVPIKADSKVDPLDPLMIVHHPRGLPQRLSRFRCVAVTETGQPDVILGHRCDTQHGSSGSLVLDENLIPVAIHHRAGLQPDDPGSFNKATYMSSVLGVSAYLPGVVQAANSGDQQSGNQQTQSANPKPAPTTNGETNDQPSYFPSGNAEGNDTNTINQLIGN